MPVGDYFRKIFGGPFRKETDMGDGSHAERIIAMPPADMVVDGRLLVDAEMDFPPAMLNGDRLKVDLDEPIDVTLPAALINAGRLKVQVDSPNPLPVSLPASLISGTTKPRIRVDVGQTGFFEKREFETFREFATATTGTYILRVVSPINFILQELELELEAGTVRLATFAGGTPTGSFSETLPYTAANTMSETPPAYTPQISLTAIPTGGSLAGGTAIRVTRVKAADNSNFASSVGSTPDLVAGRAAGTYYIVLTLTAAIGVLKGRIEERP